MSRNPASPSSPTPSAIADAAATWLARHDAGLSAAEQAEFDAWLAADSRQAAAWREIAAVWAAFDEPRNEGAADGMIRELAARRHRRRWRVRIGLSAGLAAAASVALMIFLRPDRAAAPAPKSAPERIASQPTRSAPPAAPDAGSGAAATPAPDTEPAAIAVVVIKPDRRVLSDGSVVEMDRGAEIAEHYTPDRRAVTLLRGEALFTVAKNAARPFIVTTGLADVQAVGTAFAVKLGAQEVAVLVTEGRVAVDRTEDAGAAATASAPREIPVLVDAGNRLVLARTAAPGESLNRLEAVEPAEIDRQLAWRGPRLELSGTRLSDAVAALNRENSVRLRIAGRALAEMRLSGVFRADDAEGFARLLESNYGVLSERHDGEIVLHQP
jgi:transmembrane sensor